MQVLADAVPVHVGANARTHVIGTLARGDVAEVLGFDKFRVDGFVGLAGIGWVRYDPSLIELSAPPKEVPNYFGHILDPAHLPGTRTGVATVDRVLDLLDDGDAAGLIALAPASPVPCVQPGQFDGPVCPDGTEPGTPVDAFTSLTCHGEHDPTAERAIGALVRGNPSPVEVFAVYALSSDDRLGFEETEFLIVLSSAGAAAVDAEGLIAFTLRSCGPETLLPSSESTFLLPPVPRPLREERSATSPIQ